jgi:hypothetical protein
MATVASAARVKARCLKCSRELEADPSGTRLAHKQHGHGPESGHSETAGFRVGFTAVNGSTEIGHLADRSAHIPDVRVW